MSLWLFGIASRVALAHRRRAVSAQNAGTAQERGSARQTVSDPVCELECSETRRTLDRAIELLDAQKREVFVAFDLEGLPMA